MHDWPLSRVAVLPETALFNAHEKPPSTVSLVAVTEPSGLAVTVTSEAKPLIRGASPLGAVKVSDSVPSHAQLPTNGSDGPASPPARGPTGPPSPPGREPPAWELPSPPVSSSLL